MSNYVYCNDELYHYGVPGMRWGVRKARYKSMSRKERKATRQAYYNTPKGKMLKVARNTVIGNIAAGPLVGVTAGLITAKRNGTLDLYGKKGRDFMDQLKEQHRAEKREAERDDD